MSEMLGKESKPHEVTAFTEENNIVLKRGNVIIETITAAELDNKLDSHSKQLIQAFEKSMYYNFELWTRIYPERNKSSDPIVNIQIENKLKEIGKQMCKEWNNIYKFLNQLRYKLDDHYGQMEFLCNEVIQL
jgi:hypothetical protein